MKSFLFYHATSQASVVIITIALMLFVGYLMTRITRKFKLPNVTGYILAGILMGPYCLDMVPVKVIDGMDFLSDIALAFIAFSTGEFFRFSVLKKNGWKVIVITVMEAVLASVCVFAVVYGVLHLNLAFSIVLAALASATAPASTIMTIRQYQAKGEFVNTILQVGALERREILLILFCRWWHWMMWLVWWSTVRLFLLRWQLFPGLVVSRWEIS